MRILNIEDDKSLCRTLEIHLGNDGHDVKSAYLLQDGFEQARTWRPNLIFLDFHLPDQHDLTSIAPLLETVPDCHLVMITGDTDNTLVIEAIRQGVHDYLRKPLNLDDINRIIDQVSRQMETLQNDAVNVAAEMEIDKHEIVGSHPDIVELHKRIALLSNSKVTVLILGESGTGKELAARILHRESCPRQLFIPINCSAIVPTLLESELFGHEKGSYTGASSKKTGKLEYAGQGTVFLDEIADMPLDLQAKLLRVLQEGEFVRVGGLEPIPLRARIVAATNSDLKKRISEKRFRKDLYYRLAISRLELPPLRDRQEDMPFLVGYLLAKISHKLDRQVHAVENEVLEKFCNYSWPGNIRELENMLTNGVVLTHRNLLTLEDLDFSEWESTKSHAFHLNDFSLGSAEKKHIKLVLNKFQWNILKTAKQLQVCPNTLRKKISSYDLKPSRRKHDLEN